MKFAFIIIGDFASADSAKICGGAAQIIGVRSIAEAETAARCLAAEGIGCIELCGAFGEEGARKIIAATEGRLPIGYVTHLSEQDEIYKKAFGSKA